MSKFVFFVSVLLICTFKVYSNESKSLYQLPAKSLSKGVVSDSVFLSGTTKGLFKVSKGNSSIPLWTDGEVMQIVHTNVPVEGGGAVSNWYFRTSKGILFSSNLEEFEIRNEGLPHLTVKKYDGHEISFEKVVHQLKDLSVNPLNPKQLITATKDNCFISYDGGKNWQSIDSMSRSTSGIKAVALVSMPYISSNGETAYELVAFMSQPLFGFSYKRLEAAKPAWIDVKNGFDFLPSMSYPDEISDILPVPKRKADGSFYVDLYISQMYLPRIYKFDWGTKKAEKIYSGEEPLDSIDGLTFVDDNLIYSTIEGLASLNMQTLQSPGIPERLEDWKRSFASSPGALNCGWIPADRTGFKKPLILNELWMLYPGTTNTPYAQEASNKKSIYASAYQCRIQSGIDKFKKIITDNNLNSLVIDMKDDYGFLRYNSKNSEILAKAKTSMYALDLEHFVEEFKKDDVYLIARIVVFKDRSLSKYSGGKYAVWDYKTKAPWAGIRQYEDVIDEESGTVTGVKPAFYDEAWVDPYCPEVWEYNTAIAKELIERGFDEIQFDYIRFPTDGLNLSSAAYRWKSEGMDKESAIVSFLSFARENIKAPIAIDIYGANGWYRSGARTGQDVELMADYVDVIAPMFYPSHFEQTFMNYEPKEDRTYRIFFYGTYRNSVISRNRAIIRPWAQAFYLNVSYDRAFYNKDYVQKQIFGVRDSVNNGYMYWNNSGEYGMISPDIKDDEPFTGSASEADLKYRKPALGKQKAPPFNNETVSVMDSVYKDSKKTWINNIPFFPVLRIQKIAEN